MSKPISFDHFMPRAPAARRQLRHTTTQHVVVANYSGYIIGDDAIFEALLSLIHGACGADVAIDALTAHPGRTRERYHIQNVEHVYRYPGSGATWRRVAAMVASADLIVVGGGDIMEGQTSWLWLMVLAFTAGTPVAIVGVGVLTPASATGRLTLRTTIALARYVAVRDSSSHQQLRDVGVRRKTIEVLPDLAVVVASEGVDANLAMSANRTPLGDRPYIAVNLRAPEPWQYKITWGDAEYETLATVCRGYIDQRDMDVVLVSMSSEQATTDLGAAEVPDDVVLRAFAEKIARPGHVHVESGENRPGDVCRVLSGAQLAVGMRLHFLLLAACQGIPVIGLNYAHKVRSFFHAISLDMYCLDIQHMSVESVERTFNEALERKVHLQQLLTKWKAEAIQQVLPLSTTFAYLSQSTSRGRDLRRFIVVPLAVAIYQLKAMFKSARHRIGIGKPEACVPTSMVTPG